MHTGKANLIGQRLRDYHCEKMPGGEIRVGYIYVLGEDAIGITIANEFLDLLGQEGRADLVAAFLHYMDRAEKMRHD